MVCLFVKQKTAYEMRISDWSSDVCSSDLPALEARDRLPQHRHDDAAGKRRALEKRFVDEFRGVAAGAKLRHSDLPFAEEVDAKAPVALDMFRGDRRFVDADQQGWRLHTHWSEGADGHAPRATLMIRRDTPKAGAGAAHRSPKDVATGIELDRDKS